MPIREFPGVLTEAKFTPVPDTFFTQAMPQIQDITELKITLCVFYLLNYKHRRPPYVTNRELLSHRVSAIGVEQEVFQHALQSAINHEAILHLNLNTGSKWEDVYFANTERDREVVARIRSGEFSIESTKSSEGEAGQAPHLANIFTLYEQNIGVITPMIAEELKEAERVYPWQWINDAFREAVLMNKRSWKYIARILERWATEGKDSGKHRQGTEKDSADKYISGRYGHRVRR